MNYTFPFYLCDEYLLITNQKIASTFLTQYVGEKKFNNLNYNIQENKIFCINHPEYEDELNSIISRNKKKQIIILTREPEGRYISGLIQDIFPEEINKGLSNIKRIVSEYGNKREINNFSDYTKHFNIKNFYIFNESNETHKQSVRIMIKCLLKRFFEKDFIGNFWGPHRKPHDSILSLMLFINNNKNFTVFDIECDGDLFQFLNSKKELKSEIEKNVKSNNNTILNRMAKDLIQNYHQKELSIIRNLLKVETSSYIALKTKI